MLNETLAAYPLGLLQDLVTLHSLLERRGLTIQDVRDHIQALHRHNAQEWRGALDMSSAMEKVLPKCPDCGDIPMLPRAAAPPTPGDEALDLPPDPGDPAEGSYWICPKCRFSTFDSRELLEIQAEINRLARASARRNARKSGQRV